MISKKSFLCDEEIQITIYKLNLRINDRFENSGLSNTCKTLHDISLETKEKLQWIVKPNYSIRFFAYLIILSIVFATIYSIATVDVTLKTIDISSLIQMLGSALEGIAITIAGIVFIITFENKNKRTKIVSAVNNLRCIAHIIDMHQLTKAPDIMVKSQNKTSNSPKRKLNEYELGRYLDYCSEMLSLTSKLGFLYIQRFPDPIATDAVNDLEALITGLSGKIWQKIVLINTKQQSK